MRFPWEILHRPAFEQPPLRDDGPVALRGNAPLLTKA